MTVFGISRSNLTVKLLISLVADEPFMRAA